jgi:hypothetical protein
MHMLSINTGSTVWALLFKEKEKADAAEASALAFLRMQHLTQQTVDNRVITIEDDFGQRAHLVAGGMHGVLVEDCDLTQEAAIQRHILQQITNVKAQTRVRNDPVLKAANLGTGYQFNPVMNGRQ